MAHLHDALGFLLVLLLLVESSRLSLKVAARLGRRTLLPAVWVATVGFLSWAVAEGLSAAGWLTPSGLMVVWALVLAGVHRRARGASLGAWPEVPAQERPLLAVAVVGLGILLAGTLLIALVAPPNNCLTIRSAAS